MKTHTYLESFGPPAVSESAVIIVTSRKVLAKKKELGEGRGRGEGGEGDGRERGLVEERKEWEKGENERRGEIKEKKGWKKGI